MKTLKGFRTAGRVPPLGRVAAIFAIMIFIQECIAMAEPRVIETVFPTDDVVIASGVVEPAADERADMTETLQGAIDEIAQLGGGVVFVRAGRYLVAGRLIVKEGVTVRGDWPGPLPEHGAAGTILMLTADRGESEGPPAITLQRGSGIRELTLWYPEQAPADIAPYPPTIRTSQDLGGDNTTVMNVTLVNPYQAIQVGPEWNELHTVRNVYGTPLKNGLRVDSTTDIGRLIDVDFRPEHWEQSGLANAPATESDRQAVRDFIAEQGIAIDMGRSDWEYIYHVTADGYGIGCQFRQGARGTMNGVMFGCEFFNCGTGLEIQHLNGIGLSATGCAFEGEEHAIHGAESFGTIAQFNTCDIRGGAEGVLLEGSGIFTFQNCTHSGWADTAVRATSGEVTACGCSFEGGGPHIELGRHIERARVLGNAFAGEPKIVNEAERADVQIAHSGFEFSRPDVSLPASIPDRRPSNDRLFVVVDYGASPELSDNTAAFADALQAARGAGGGTVYVPAGNYRFAGEIIVPEGVELRGCFDVPHHTISAGSVLMPTSGRGDADGTPFIRLEQGSGVRGITVWYPEQAPNDIAAYPWAIQSTGPHCWLIDVTLGNAYQGADFWTYPSDGHLIRYLAGACLKRALYVSKCDGKGRVEDLQFNPHYMARLHGGLPRPEGDVDFGRIIDYQRHYLDGFIFGRCRDEEILRTFLYDAYDGIAFRDDDGGTNARIIQHGTDTGSRCAVLEAAGEESLEFINAQLVPLSKYAQGAIVAEYGFEGTARFYNSQMWAGDTTAVIAGGDVLLQQLNTLTGEIALCGGDCRIANARFSRDLRPHIRVRNPCRSAELIGNIAPHGLGIDNAIGERCHAIGNAATIPPGAKRTTLQTGWEEGDPQGTSDRIAERGGGLKGVVDATCRPTSEHAHTGDSALRISGTVDEPGYSYVYFEVFDEPIIVRGDTTLSYWIKPETEAGRHVAVDLLFDDGSTLRDSDAVTVDGGPVHPNGCAHPIGEWSQVEVRLGEYHRDKVIESVMVGYDSKEGRGRIGAVIDDLAKVSSGRGLSWQVEAEPAGGRYAAPLQVTLVAAENMAVRYTLDGLAPGHGSPKYSEPIVLEEPGIYDLRFAAESPDGDVSDYVLAELYEITEEK